MKSVLFRMTAIIALIAIIGSAFLALTRSEKVTNSEVVFTNISLSDTALNATGTFTSSGKSFRKYVYTIKENFLYISIYGGLVSNKYPNGDFIIDIQDNLKGIKKIYLKSGDEETIIFER